VHQQLYGKAPSGIGWDAFEAIASVTYAFGLTGYMPADTPQEVLDIFDKTVEAINADPEFIEASKKVTNGARLAKGSVAGPLIKKALQPSDEIRSYLKTLLSEKYGVKF
jgi:tripartite-type tricarboxylate transporter receptor subunit TctC